MKHNDSADQKARLALILRTGKLRLWIYRPATRHFYLLSEDGSIEREYNPTEFAQGYDLDDFEAMRSLVFDICDGRRTSAQVRLRSVVQADGQRSHYDITISVKDSDADGHPTTLLGVQHDVTEEVRAQENTELMLMRYRTIFNTSMLDIAFYDKDGMLTDINERACATFHLKDRNQVLNGHFERSFNPLLSGSIADFSEKRSASSIVDIAALRQEGCPVDDSLAGGIMYYESTVHPLRDEQGRPDGLYVAGRDITEKVEAFHRQQEVSRRLEKGTRAMEQHVENINYALRVSDVRLVSYNPRAYILEISDNVRHSQQRLSQLRCLTLTAPSHRRRVASILGRMDHRTLRSIEQTVETVTRDEQGRHVWLMFNMVPIIDAEGQVERYFGLCRNVTELVATEQQLAVESEKARDAERLTQAFLTNMSHEIRTPLNTVVGFANLFSTHHDERDEPFFVEQIKDGANTLLQLVNDVLFLSRLDANMEEYKCKPTDFAKLFATQCQEGLLPAKPGIKTVIGQPCESLTLTIDAGKVGLIVKRLCNLARIMTRQGTISASYEHAPRRLTISIEDTGLAFTPQTAAHLFDRFAHDEEGEVMGTGLDLPIVQMLSRQMGGSLDVQPAEGGGTVFQVRLPLTPNP